MITLDQFIEKYLGKQVEYHSFNPNAKFQCVDLVNQYIVEVLGLDAVIGTDAKDFPTKVDLSTFEVFKNTPEFIPIKGDIAVWNGRVGGGAGHIAVVTDNKATANSFNSLDQNWNKPLFVTLENHTYVNASHFLRAKVTANPGKTYTQAEWQIERDERNKNWGLYQEQLTKNTELSGENSIVRKQLSEEKERHQKDLESIAVELNVSPDISKIIPAVKTCITFEDQVTDLTKKRAEERTVYDSNIQKLQESLEDLQKQLNIAKDEIERLKEEKPESVPSQPQLSLLQKIIQFFLRN